jgi:response regulator RpfG family c-di-GMP phosphodiesterase
MESAVKAKILYVDDEAHNLVAFRANFRRDFEVLTAGSVSEALEVLEKEDVHVLVTDQRMPEQLGTELLAVARSKYPDQARILLTGFTELDALRDAVNEGKITCYVQKPWEAEALRKILLEAARDVAQTRGEKKLARELIRTNEQLEFILRQRLIS